VCNAALSILGFVLLRLCEFALLGLVVVGVLSLTLYRFYSRELPDPAQLAMHRPFETTRIYARDGQRLLYELFADGQRTVVPLSDVPEALQHATIATEDADFYEHPGVDMRAIVRAAWLNRNGDIRSGASTITQQLARNSLLSADERSQQTFDRKAREAILAFEFNRRFSKEQILGFYLNEVYYGNGAYGIEAAAQNYFGKHARDLDLAESALLAGLVQAPTELNPLHAPEAAQRRRKIVLDSMVKQGYISRTEAAAAAAAPIKVQLPVADIHYPHWVFYVRDLLEQRYGVDMVQRGGLRVTTSLDPALQDMAEAAVRTRMAELRGRNADNAGVVMIDPRTNEVLAMVGSANYNNTNIDGQFNVARGARQPGSALKPIVYAAAMMRGWTPATVIWDTPTNFNGYKPQNYDNKFHGPQRLRQALATSLNIPAVKALQFVGLHSFADLAHAMGITTLNKPEQYGLSAALGSGEVKLIDVANAYATFANGGKVRPVAPILSVTTNRGETLYRYEPPAGTQTLGPHGEAIAYLVSDMLSDNDARRPMFGAHSAMRLDGDRPAAVKTGTTDDFKDSWAVGYTPSLVVGVWVGNTDNSPMDHIAGSDGAGVIWHDIMEAAHAGKPTEAFARPADVVEAPICASDGLLAAGCTDTKQERFVTGMLPPAQNSMAGKASHAQACDVVQGCVATNAVATLSAPTSGAGVSGVVSILGSVSSTYTITFGKGDQPDEWMFIAEGQGPRTDAVLGAWNTDVLSAGVYTLRLELMHSGKPAYSTQVQVHVERQAVAVQLVQPAPHTRIAVGTLLPLMAEASGAQRIEFLVDDQMIGGTNQPTATWNWLASTPGQHTIKAVAYDASGNRTVSMPLVIVVE
jgi:1A family penicillin-binding protein